MSNWNDIKTNRGLRHVDYQVLEAEKEVLQKVNQQLQDALHDQERKMELKLKHKLRMEQMHFENQIESHKVQQHERDIQLHIQEEDTNRLQDVLDKLSTQHNQLESQVNAHKQQKEEVLRNVQSIQNIAQDKEQQLNKLHHDIIDRDNEIASLNLQILQLQYENKNQETLMHHSEQQLREQKIRNQIEMQMMKKRSEYMKKLRDLKI
eukprot:CAMPEP_0117451972 /NCGR_PEP_ID=MMETSP0759-20121206/9320_1 /TAXON_ID=63605 /ORGANISM="Percolomonas cosmopolitus, Strain WS" /LENGTH=206 /DNA_ID=CAMNT_0005244663 /DNA_START=189 /DNA_END=809 /DNA_ORIENTATION=+